MFSQAKSIPPLVFYLKKVDEEYFINGVNVKSNEFLTISEWKRLRYQVLQKFGPICQCCGASAKSGVVINIDHIKPRKLFPELALKFMNLQVLCADCNAGKGNIDQTDWRR